MEPAYRRSRREAIVALLLWALPGVWTISVSYWLGYNEPPRSLGGIPHWVVWGVFLPWFVLFLLHTWFSFFYMRDNGDAAKPPSARDSAGQQS
jgi:hypothetical protein